MKPQRDMYAGGGHISGKSGGRDEAFDQLIDIVAAYIETSDPDTEISLKEKICSTFIDPITVYQDKLNRIESIAKEPRE